MSRTFNYNTKKYGYKAYGVNMSERSPWKRQYNKAIRHAEFTNIEGLSEKELLNRELALYKSEEYKNACASEQQRMINQIDMMAEVEYSYTTPTTKVKGHVCW